MLKKDKILLVVLSLVVTCCFQLTDVKILSIKIAEFFMLAIFPFMISRKLNKFIIYFFGFFTIYLLTTFALNLNQVFYLPLEDLYLLKRPYLISLSRYLELIACISFALFVYKIFKYFVDEKGYSLAELLKHVLFINLLFSLFFILVFLYYKINHFTLNVNSFIVHNPADTYDSSYYRLRGFYFEGGPLGLFYAFLFILTTLLPGKNWIYKTVFFLIIILASSKAGMLMVIFWLLFSFIVRYRIPSLVKTLLIPVLAIIFFVSFTFIAANYIELLDSIESTVKDRPDDYALVMGRVAGIFIVPNMVLSNPLLGVGLGNYPLVRNNPDYLGIFPYVTLWDEHGLGGLVSLLVEGGIIFSFLFLVIIYFIYKELSVKQFNLKSLILLLIIPSLLGVQLHFMYIWFAVGLILFLIQTQSPVDLQLLASKHRSD